MHYESIYIFLRGWIRTLEYNNILSYHISLRKVVVGHILVN